MKKALFLILALAFLLSFISLKTLPSGFTPDEASFGYDAYSILNSGKDQWGHVLPLVLKSFGDFKAPLYAYLTIPFVLIFGLTELAVRLPNVLLGTAAVYVVYLLIGELIVNGLLPNWLNISNKKVVKDSLQTNELVGLLAAFLFGDFSMAYNDSRGAFGANLTTFFFPIGILLFLRGLRFQSWAQYLWSSIFLGVNLFSYHSAKFITPLVVIVLYFMFGLKASKSEKTRNTPFLIVFGIFLLVSVFLFFRGAGTQAKDINITNGALEQAFNDRQQFVQSGMDNRVARVFHNKYQVTLKRFVSNYSQYFSHKFLLSDGPAETTYGMIPGIGVINFVELVLLLAFVVLFARNLGNKTLWFIVIWLLVAPIPAALTTGPGYAANRAVSMIPVLQIALSLGALELYKLVTARFRYLSKPLFFGLFVVEILFVASALVKYYYLSPLTGSQGMLYGRLEAVSVVNSLNKDRYPVIMDKSLSEPHIYVAFQDRVKPGDYQSYSSTWNFEEAGVNWVDQLPEYRLGDYLFKNIDFGQDVGKGYLVGLPTDFPEDKLPDRIIYYPNGDPAIFIFFPTQKVYANVY